MAGINKVILVGNLGADPEVRYTQAGMAIASLRIATSENRKDRASGESREFTEWHRVKCFDRLAEICGEYLRKGSKVYIEGTLRTSKYEKEGQTHYSTDIIGREMQMLDRKGQSGDDAGFERQPAAAARSGGTGGGMRDGGRDSGRDGGGASSRREPAAAPVEDFDDDIPF